MTLINNWSININNLPDYNEFYNTEFVEIIDNINIISYINNISESVIPESKKKYFKRIFDNFKIINDKAYLNVKYNRLYPLGRFYPSNNLSLLYAPREIKQIIFKNENWLDLDIKKCYQTIIYEIGKLNNYNFKTIYRYIYDNDNLYNEFNTFYNNKISKTDFKKIFCSLIFKSNFFNFLDKIFEEKVCPLENDYINEFNFLDNIYNDKISSKDNKFRYYHKVCPLLDEYINEINIFRYNILNSNVDFINIIKNYIMEKQPNISKFKYENLIICKYLDTIESYVLFIVYNFLKNKNLIHNNIILEFDGLCIKNCQNKHYLIDLIPEINNEIFKHSNLNIIIDHKIY